MTAHDLTVRDMPVTDLALLPGNPRQGDIGAVAESMRVNGVYQPIIVNKGTHTGRPYEVIAGNHRAQAAQQLGHDTIPAVILDVNDEQAARIALADNRTSDLADYDTDALVVMLQGLPDLTGTGYDGDDLDDLLRELDYAAAADGVADGFQDDAGIGATDLDEGTHEVTVLIRSDHYSELYSVLSDLPYVIDARDKGNRRPE